MRFESPEYREQSLKREAIRHITSAASFFEKIGSEVLEIREEQTKRRMSPESGLLSSLAVKDLEETARLIRESSPEKSQMCAELAKEMLNWFKAVWDIRHRQRPDFDIEGTYKSILKRVKQIKDEISI